MNVRQAVARNAFLRSSGYAFLRARARLAPDGAPPRVLVNSIPKSGTHLATAAIDRFPDMRFSGIYAHTRGFAMPGQDDEYADSELGLDWERLYADLSRPKDGQYVVAHLWPYPKLIEILRELDYKVLFVFRDPRDIVVSTAMYRKNLARHPQNRRFTEAYTDDRQRMLATITGYPADEHGRGASSLGFRLRTYLPWFEAPNTLACRFEDLIGERGGGSAEQQIAAIREIGDHIDRPLSRQAAAEIARSAWSTKSATFRSGAIGQWRSLFDEGLHECFSKEVDDELLRAYAYLGAEKELTGTGPERR